MSEKSTKNSNTSVFNNLNIFQNASVLLQTLPGLTNTGLDVRALNKEPDICIKGSSIQIMTVSGTTRTYTDYPSSTASKGEAPVWSGFRIKLTDKIEIGYWHMHFFTRTASNRLPTDQYLAITMPTKSQGAQFILDPVHMMPNWNDEVGDTELPQNFTPLTYFVCQATTNTSTQGAMFFQIPRVIFYSNTNESIFNTYVSQSSRKLIFNADSLSSWSSVYDLYIIGRSIDV